MVAARKSAKVSKASRKAAKKSAKKTKLTKSSRGVSSIDVRTPGDIGKLMKMFKSFPIVLVLVYADWCGHCQTYKKDIWSQLEKVPNRTVGLAKLNESQLANSPLKSSKIEGYPSLLVVGKDGKAAEFKNESTGEPTNALPNDRDMEMMKNLVKGNIPKNVSVSASAAPSVSAEEDPMNVNASAENVSAEEIGSALTNTKSTKGITKPFTPEALQAREKAGNAFLSNAASAQNMQTALEASVNESKSPSVLMPPNAEEDLVESHTTLASANASGAATASANTAVQLGGSLYAAMLEAAGAIAPAAALAGAGIYLTKRGKTARRRKVVATRAKKLATRRRLAKLLARYR
jgi:thiol-disulfide isomerase/thioredoxin